MQQAQAQAQAQAAQQQGHAPTPQQLSQQAMSRFPSNIDAHLRPLGPIRFQQPPQPQPQQAAAGAQAPPPSQQQQSGGPSPSPSQSQSQASPQQQQQQAAAAAAAAAAARARGPEVEMALQDAMRVCNPDIKTPFQSIEDAVSSLLSTMLPPHQDLTAPSSHSTFTPTMDDAVNPTPISSASAAMAAAVEGQHQLLGRQIFLIQEALAKQGHAPTPVSCFPSDIGAHLCFLSPIYFQPSQSQTFPQQQPAATVWLPSPEVEMALQDVWKVCNPDFKTPFQSVEDAVSRLLPYHVVADYEAEEDDRILDSDTTGQIPSRLQQWDHNILERLMLEQALLMEEKQAMMGLRAEIESREKAGREAAEAKMRMAMAEQARAEAQAHSEMIGHGPLRTHAAASQGEDGPSHEMMQEQGEDGWGNAQRDDEDPSEDFLNDENEPENGNSDMQEDWRRSGELDLNSRCCPNPK
uniref:GLTSCR protein conserved domain-containing protein n=1 Tax=Leersia perrieri TaxID=77586 RepID=A0A0D9XZ59_9ORYZ